VTHIDLFSGIGGFALAAKWAGFHTVCFVEIEPYAQKILIQNFGAVADANGTGQQQHSRGEPVQPPQLAAQLHSDVRTFDATRYAGATLLTGGFPCQPFSQAGKRRGRQDDRYLWPEMLRVIQEARPAWIVGENVAGIIGMELDRCLSDLESEGYSCQALVIPACAVDAKHRRDRVWIVAHAALERINGTGNARERRRDEPPDRCRWLPEPNVGRVAHGIPNRVDRLKALGNAIVPQVAYQILKGIAEIEKCRVTA
jgi:DNA (cytosine-5)-methyltransferase 1